MAQGVISAIQEKFETLSFFGRPPVLWFGDAPLVDPDGKTVNLPVVQFYNESSSEVTTFEAASVQTWMFRFELYTVTLDECQRLASGILYNNEAPDTVQGLAYTRALPLPSEYRFLQLIPRGVPRYQRLVNPRTSEAMAAHVGTFMMSLEIQYVGPTQTIP